MLLGGFDLVPEVLQQMEKGYVQAQVDQQPYMQGFMPVMEVYLSKTVGLAPSDIDTGQGIVRKDQVSSHHGPFGQRHALRGARGKTAANRRAAARPAAHRCGTLFPVHRRRSRIVTPSGGTR